MILDISFRIVIYLLAALTWLGIIFNTSLLFGGAVYGFLGVAVVKFIHDSARLKTKFSRKN